MKTPTKIRTEINPTNSSLSSSLKSPRRPPPSLTLLDAIPRCRREIQAPSATYSYSAVKYHYHPISPYETNKRRTLEEDGRSFIDWLFVRPFRCKGNQTLNKFNSIASIFSMPGMPSAAELLCGSIDGAMMLEEILAGAVGILSSGNGAITGEQENSMNNALSEVSFQVGSGPIIRYTNGEFILPTLSAGIASEEAFNTMKKICGFKEKSDDNSELHGIFTKQQMSCPISDTLHHVEFRRTASFKEEIAFRLERKQTDLESKTIIEDACHRFLATGIEDEPIHFLITGRPLSGKSTILREFRKTLSTIFHKWNVIDGNIIANHISSSGSFSSCLHSYIKEIMSNNISNNPYVLIFDDLSLEHGLPIVQDVAQYCGIHVIATIGNGQYNMPNLTKSLARLMNSAKTMVLEIRPDMNNLHCDHSNRKNNGATSRKRKMRDAKSKYKLITIGNISKRPPKRQKKSGR